uniref:Uncharacterized protein n=1 Tax=Anguilla anguilla TaxID=7936 RepID=A0A0E9UF62_ANGAN
MVNKGLGVLSEKNSSVDGKMTVGKSHLSKGLPHSTFQG